MISSSVPILGSSCVGIVRACYVWYRLSLDLSRLKRFFDVAGLPQMMLDDLLFTFLSVVGNNDAVYGRSLKELLDSGAFLSRGETEREPCCMGTFYGGEGSLMSYWLIWSTTIPCILSTKLPAFSGWKSCCLSTIIDSSCIFSSYFLSWRLRSALNIRSQSFGDRIMAKRILRLFFNSVAKLLFEQVSFDLFMHSFSKGFTTSSCYLHSFSFIIFSLN